MCVCSVRVVKWLRSITTYIVYPLSDGHQTFRVYVIQYRSSYVQYADVKNVSLIMLLSQWRTEGGWSGGLGPRHWRGKFFVGILITHSASKYSIFNQKYKIISWVGAQPLPRPLLHWGGGHPSSSPPPRRLRRLYPIHAEILGTPLCSAGRMWTVQESLARDSSVCMKAPSEEIYGKSTQRRTLCWKVHSVGYNAGADNTGLS